METFLIRALQLIMSLSLLVIIHEGGHFLFSRLFKVRVEKFYIFFDPWFSLFKFKPKNSDTEYGIGWVPLGGYVKISGMIDESMDTEQMKQPAKPWEFRSKPAWQRLLIMVGGVLMNFLLAIFIYSMILFHWGDSFVSLQDMTHGMKFNERAREIGFRDGDILLRADEKPLERFGVDMLRDIAEARTVTVLRDGKEAEVYMPEISLLDIAKDDPMFVTALVPNVVDSVIPGGGLDKAGIQKGDSLVAVNGERLNSWNALVEKLDNMQADAEATGDKDASLQMVYSRNGLRDTVTVRTDSLFRVGATFSSLADYKETTREFGFFESFPAGVQLGVNTLKDMLRDIAEARTVTVLRDGKEAEVYMPEISLLDIAKDDPMFVTALVPNVVDSVIPGGGLDKAGIQKGDSLVAVNGERLNSWNALVEKLDNMQADAEATGDKDASLQMVYSRNGLRDTVTVRTDSLFRVGATFSSLADYKETTREFGFFESFPAGVQLGVNTLKGYVNDMKYVFTKEGAKSVGGFGTIGSIFPKVWDWHRFWEMTAFLSIILAFMNILPIPALDGGHVLFLLYEIIARRKPSDKFMEYAQMVGMFLLFALLIWANFNDIMRFLF